jgi:hypothetical protein
MESWKLKLTFETASSLNISGQKTVSARPCDSTCNVSKLWSLDLHIALSKLNPDLVLFDLQISKKKLNEVVQVL